MESLDFENFPRGQLLFRFTRRQLWMALSTEFVVIGGIERGGAAFKLSDLGALPDDVLADIIPAVVSGCHITVRDGFVWGQPPTATEPIQLFPLDSPALTAFNLFNGLTSLAEAAQCLTATTDWEPAFSFAVVRGLFLCLVLARICAPKG